MPNLNPTEIDYSDYRDKVKMLSEVVADRLDESTDKWRLIDESVEGDSWIIHYGYPEAILINSDSPNSFFLRKE